MLKGFIDKADKVNLLYGYETKDFMQMLCLKKFNNYFCQRKKILYIYFV